MNFKNNILFLIFALFMGLSPAFATEHEAKFKKVAYIVDGDTLVTTDGHNVRLLGINTTEMGKKGKPSEPFANAGRKKLQELVEGKTLRLEYGERMKDRYGRLLAHLYLEDGTWVNGAMVESGLAHVYSFPDNRMHTRTLITLEKQARSEKKGLWSHPRWKIYSTEEEIPDSAMGKFNIAEGKVHHITQVKDRTYINFGANWREDFTVEIPSKNTDIFKKEGINIKQAYEGKTLQIRGVFKPVNGALVTVTHPEQLTILD